MNLPLKIKKPFVNWQLPPAGSKQMPWASVDAVDEDEFEENRLILQSKLDWNMYRLGFYNVQINFLNCSRYLHLGFSCLLDYKNVTHIVNKDCQNVCIKHVIVKEKSPGGFIMFSTVWIVRKETEINEEKSK